MIRAFFEEGRNNARRKSQSDIDRGAGVDIAPVQALIHDGQAFRALASGRQDLCGDIGFTIKHASIQEVIREPQQGGASWR
jgi:hypothetical protein